MTNENVKEVSNLIDACHFIGSRTPFWTQGAGGNVSIKSGAYAFIKASGARLDNVGATSTLCKIEIASFRKNFSEISQGKSDSEEAYARLLKIQRSGSWGMASMESGFHLGLKKTFVAHFHALSAIVMGDIAHKLPRQWSAFLEKVGRKSPAIIAPILPGLQLSTAVTTSPENEIYLLRQHGVILAGDSITAIQDWIHFESLFCNDWGYESLLPQSTGPLQKLYKSGNLKLYFPDVAVFKHRIEAITEKSDLNKRSIIPEKAKLDKDALEIWYAIQLLMKAQPRLAELPRYFIDELSKMACEKWRQVQSEPSRQ